MKNFVLKKFSVLLAFLFISGAAFCQTDSTKEAAVYLRCPVIPKFTVYKAPDSTAFTREELHKKRNTVFMVFSPDCSHCQHETEMLLQNLSQFKNTQFVMVTYLPWEDMIAFYHHYQLDKHPQFTVARDTRFFFPVFFQVKNLPSIFVYNKEGKFVKSFEGDVKPASILEVL